MDTIQKAEQLKTKVIAKFEKLKRIEESKLKTLADFETERQNKIKVLQAELAQIQEQRIDVLHAVGELTSDIDDLNEV
jgi:uncharacterized protein YPO0396